MPIRGAIKLRSMLPILTFLARGIREAEEVEVAPDPRSGDARPGPRSTLAIDVTTGKPPAGPQSIRYGDRFFAVRDTRWDRTSLLMLDILFQTTVGDIANVGVPITISK